MKKIILLSIFCNLLLSKEGLEHNITYVENNNSIYIESNITRTEIEYFSQIKNFIDNKIKAFSKDAFESNNDFHQRKNIAVADLELNTTKLIQKGINDYGAGYAKMYNYDAENEIIALKLEWNKYIVNILPNINNQKTVYSHITKDDAKEMFDSNITRPFYIKVIYNEGKLSIIKTTISNNQKNYILEDIIWIDNSKVNCKRRNLKSKICEDKWKNSKNICKFINARLPSIDELTGKIIEYGGIIQSKNNKYNNSYNKSYKRNGFTGNYFWSSTDSSDKNKVLIVNFHNGGKYNGLKNARYSIKCVKDKIYHNVTKTKEIK